MANSQSLHKIDNVLKFRALGLRSRLTLYKRIKSYTEEQFPIASSLEKFKARYDKAKDPRGKVIEIWLSNMANGATFVQAIEGWIPDTEMNLITAGDEGRGIEYGLAEAIKFTESAEKIKKVIRSNAAYPVVLGTLIYLMLSMFALKLAPTYLRYLDIKAWPSLAQTLYYIGNALASSWIFVIMFLIIMTITVSMTISKWTGSLREIADKFPPWSIYKTYQGCSFLISLASMMQSGRPLNKSLQRLKESSPEYLGFYIDKMLENLKTGGKNFGVHLNVGLLDDETAGDVEDYSSLGRFEEAIYNIGESNLENSIEKIELKMMVVRTLMMFVVALTLGWMYYANIELNTAVAEAASSTNH